MLRREDMLELTRRMTPARSSIDRIAGCYFDEDGYSAGSFNRNFLNLKVSEKEKNLKLAKAIPFSETNVQLTELDFPGETRESGDMMRLLDAIMECGLKNDALLETFYEVLAEQQPKGRPFAVFLFHPVHGDYETGEPFCGFLYPSFKDRSTDIFHIALFEKDPGVSGEGLLRTLGCERDE